MFKVLTKSIIFISIFLSFLLASQPIYAQEFPRLPLQDLPNDIDTFIGAGAVGFLVWDWDGSIASGGEICDIIKEKSAQYPNAFIGTNVYLLADWSVANTYLQNLKNNCGGTMIRFWGANPATTPLNITADKLRATLDMAQGAGVRAIIAMGDYGGFNDFNHNWVLQPEVVHPNPAPWYGGAYNTNGYDEHITALLSAVGGHPALWGVELANEAHCGGHADATSAYNSWARDMSNLTRSMTGVNIGIGQAASHPVETCDYSSPNFVTSNQQGSINVASTHFYTPEMRDIGLRALGVSPVPFYVGEAGYGESSNPYDPSIACEGMAQRTDVREPEFHSLRPYPACPFDPSVQDITYYMCGSDFVAKQELTIESPFVTAIPEPNKYNSQAGVFQVPNSCVWSPTSVTCNYVMVDRIVPVNVDASRLTFPIMGLTEGPQIANSEDRSFDGDFSFATRMEEYVSWYLNGSIYRAEENYAKFDEKYPEEGAPVPKDSHGNPESGGRRVIDLSGPINKLLPWRINIEKRLEQLRAAKGGTRRNQIAACVYDITTSGIPGLGELIDVLLSFGSWLDSVFSDGNPTGMLDLIPGPCYPESAKGENLDTVSVPVFADIKIERVRIAAWEDGFSGSYGNYSPPEKLSKVAEDYDEIVDGDTFVDFYKTWHRFMGEYCTPTLDLGFELYLCFDEPTSLEGLIAQNFWGNMYMYMPMMDTEDMIGFLEADLSHTEIPPSDVAISAIRYEPDGPIVNDGKFDNLYFPHMRETTELAQTLQETYKPSVIPTYIPGETRGLYDTDRCEIQEYRTNKGDRLYGGVDDASIGDGVEISGDMVYSGSFSCTFQITYSGGGGGGGTATALCGGYATPGSTHCNIDLCQQFTCDPDGNNDGQWGPSEGCGVCAGQSLCAANPICEGVVPGGGTTVSYSQCTVKIANAIYLYTETPKIDEAYQRLVNGGLSIFRRIYPKFGQRRPIKEIKDIPGKSKETMTYTAPYAAGELGGPAEVLSGDPNIGRSGSQAMAFFPHLGSIYDYFLKGIQKALRPWSIGVYIPGIGEEPTTPPNPSTTINCNQSRSDGSFPTVYKQSSEFYKNTRCASAGRGGVHDFALAWTLTGHPHIEECYNDAVYRSLERGYNPAFTLLLWIEESGASNYERGMWYDFGVLGAIPSRNFVAQISFFLGAYSRYQQLYPTCFGGQNGYNDMQNFLGIYEAGFAGYTGHGWGESTDCTPDPDSTGVAYAERIAGFWQTMMNWACMDCPFPTSPTDNSCPAI